MPTGPARMVPKAGDINKLFNYFIESKVPITIKIIYLKFNAKSAQKCKSFPSCCENSPTLQNLKIFAKIFRILLQTR